jgi:glycosyltransferase involved in cell wall biosynthesis
MTKKTAYFDARCLQDPNYQFRGVGQHSASLLRGFHATASRDRDAVGILDSTLPPLPPEYKPLFDRVEFISYCNETRGDWFIQLSPMTHSPLKIARFLTRKTECSATIIYDFIPYDMPGHYLNDPAERLNYQICLSWLAEYEAFRPISRFSSERLRSICNVPNDRIFTTGVAVRDQVIVANRPNSISNTILLAVGADTRKNYDAAIKAHARSKAFQLGNTILIVSGISNASLIGHCRALHESEGGNPNLITFLVNVSDQVLGEAYASARVTVCPSRIEGFSIPVIEANANGCPVIISKCAAQKELIPFAEDQFEPDDILGITHLLERFCLDDSHRRSAISRQTDIWRKFTETAVATRFWDSLTSVTHDKPSAPAVNSGRRPKVLIDTPLPPTPSGVADCSYAFLEEFALHVDCYVATDTALPRMPTGCTPVGRSSKAQYASGRYDRLLSVIGNSEFHFNTFQNLLELGAASILHDARMIDFYCACFGPDRCIDLASSELKRKVQNRELAQWLFDQSKLPTLFLSEAVRSSKPAIVHSGVTQDLIKRLYGVEVKRLPFPVYRKVADDLRSKTNRQAARARTEIPGDRFLICTFGSIADQKAYREIIEAFALLRPNEINAHLHFVGTGTADVLKALNDVVRGLDLSDRVTFEPTFIAEERYQLFLSAADVAIQLRKYGLGGLSGSLLDCIAAGIPSVANAHLAAAMESPSYVKPLPDDLSPRDIAEALTDVRKSDPLTSDERKEFLAAHSTRQYCKLLSEFLEI